MKNALVTGGAGGIGAAVCRELASMGLRVGIHCHSSREQAQALSVELNGINGQDNPVLCADLCSRGETEAMFAAFGDVDLLVNNAGVAQQKLFTDITAADWEHMMAVDVTAVFHCCQLALPHMIRQKEGCIVNISSMWGQVGASCEVHYSAAKAAVIGMTKALAKEVGPSGVRVNCVSPGVIATKMNGNLSDGDLLALKEETPLERLGTPEDVARAVGYLAGPGGTFITGQILAINGGFVI